MKCTLEECPMYDWLTKDGTDCDVYGDPANCKLLKKVKRIDNKMDVLIKKIDRVLERLNG